MSPHHGLLSLVMRPSSQYVSSVGQGLCWLCMHRPHEDVVGLEWCMGMPPPPPPHCSLPKLHFSSRLCLPTMRFSPLSCFLPASFWLCMHRPRSMGMPPLLSEFTRFSPLSWARVVCGCACTGRMRTLWVWSGAWECPPLVHFLNFISLLVYVSPPCTSLPCHVSFLAGREFGWARVVMVVHAPAA